MGRLLFELGGVPQRTMHKFEKESAAAGKASFKWAWVLDENQVSLSPRRSLRVPYRLCKVVRSGPKPSGCWERRRSERGG